MTHTLTIDGEDPVALPLIVRPIEGTGLRDAISPYGYPGAAGAPERPPDPGAVDWSETGLVSVFVRDRIGGKGSLAGGTERSRVQIADPGADGGVRKRLREQIRRNERRGWRVEAVRGRDAGEPARSAFERTYAQTMARTDAAERYLYESEYFERLLGSEPAWLLLAVKGDEGPTAGAIAAASDGHLHYYLGGTAADALTDSPMKNVFAAMIDLARQLGLALNLGGGVQPGDSLESFKRGFANADAPFRTHEVVCDAEAYERLSGASGPAPAGFFPGYRAG
ncbi:MAG: GNAT family N-acetyltransferase [Solirubrobacterales bacterium]